MPGAREPVLYLALLKTQRRCRQPKAGSRKRFPQSFGTGPYLFFFFSPGKKARSTTAIMKITATTLVAMSWLPRNCPPSWLMAKRMRKKAQ